MIGILRMLNPEAAVQALLERLSVVGSERLPLREAAGRILAEPLLADRDSPPADVSAMDGYALRRCDLDQVRLPVAGEAPMGSAPPPLPIGKALRVFTGACVPLEAELVVKREDVEESSDAIGIPEALRGSPFGQFIRRQGENLKAAQTVLEAGIPISPPVAAALGSFGQSEVLVHRRVRVTLLITGDELEPTHSMPPPWRIRDSNGPGLQSMLSQLAWARKVERRSIGDTLPAVSAALEQALTASDAVILTGGVSMGQYDHVPDAVRAAGGEIVFHRLPVRPGKPALGAVGPQGQLILGLPGNPVSVMVLAYWLGLKALGRCAGLSRPGLPHGCVRLEAPVVPWNGGLGFQLIELLGAGRGRIIASRGSGDLVAAARASGFIVVAPGAAPDSCFPFFSWVL